MNIRGRCRASKAWAISTKAAVFITPLPRPWTSRPPTSWSMCSAVPATTRPTAKIAIPANSGLAGPIRSLSRPATTVANSMPITKAENAQA